MGRKRKGRDISGWLVVDKPAGMTSTAVVNKVRWAMDAKKAGHAGTLDPEATGVLAVALGEATKTVPYITDALKAYTFTVRLGQATNTDDAEGEVIAKAMRARRMTTSNRRWPRFWAISCRCRPKFSAVKIDGQRAYKLARDGEDVELSARPLWVEELVLVDRPDEDHVVLEMTCGKGGYVRSIARDLGAALGCHGHVKGTAPHLVRPVRGRGRPVHRTDRRDGQNRPRWTTYLHPLETGLSDLPELKCTPKAPPACATAIRAWCWPRTWNTATKPGLRWMARPWPWASTNRANCIPAGCSCLNGVLGGGHDHPFAYQGRCALDRHLFRLRKVSL